MDWLKNLVVSFGVLGFICIFVFLCFLGGICLHYDIHFWASYAQHHEVNVPWIPCLLVGLIPGISQLSIPAALITWICSFFL